MPITFDNQDLFSSGPARTHVGGRATRQARERPLSGRGVHLTSQGLDGRAIVQHGTLLADTHDALQAQVAAIEAKLDGVPGVLIDERSQTWAGVVMLAFEPAERERLGPRWKVDYRIEYMQPVS